MINMVPPIIVSQIKLLDSNSVRKNGELLNRVQGVGFRGSWRMGKTLELLLMSFSIFLCQWNCVSRLEGMTAVSI